MGQTVCRILLNHASVNNWQLQKGGRGLVEDAKDATVARHAKEHEQVVKVHHGRQYLSSIRTSSV